MVWSQGQDKSESLLHIVYIISKTKRTPYGNSNQPDIADSRMYPLMCVHIQMSLNF